MASDTSPALEQLYKSIQTFSNLTMAAENRDKLWKYNDALMQSLHSILEDSDCDETTKMEYFNTTMEQYTAAMKSIFPLLISDYSSHKADDSPKTIGKSSPDRFDTIQEVEKFNPYHDAKGRFATAQGYSSFTIRTKDPGKQHMANRAIEREKQRSAAAEEAAKPKFTPAKTKKEAVEYAQKELGFAKVSYGTKLDIDTINHINEQITSIQAKYPEVKGAVQELKTTTGGCYAQVRTHGDGAMNLEIGSKLYGNGMDYINRSYENDMTSGFHPAGTQANSIIWHEYGHVLANISSKGAVGASNTGLISSSSDQRKFITNRRGRETEKEWLFNAAKETGQKPSEIMKGISRYAQKNPSETFAEAFAEVTCSASPRKEAVAVVKASGWNR